MKLRLTILTICFLASFSTLVADQGDQFDWSGDPQVWGPVDYWEDDYFVCTDIAASYQLLLDFQHVEQIVDDDFKGAYGVYPVDIDGDGNIDILGAASTDDTIVWWENTNGSGTSWTEHIIVENFIWATSIYSVDIDADGDMDVLGAAGEADDITLWKNLDGLGTSWSEHNISADFDGANSVYSEDIDGDGDMDVLGAAYSDFAITWWENLNGLGTAWLEHTVDEFFVGAVSVYAADMNSDGYMDILGAARDDDDITWWENLNGLGTAWLEHTVDESFDGACFVRAADVDNDGDMDALGAARFSGEIIWWENLNGLGTAWSEHSISSYFSGAQSVHACDMDNDGDIDVLGAACEDNEISWWENENCAGTSWIKHTVDVTYDYAMSVYSEDINNDGRMDILGAAGEDNDISWWDIAGYQQSGSLESSVLLDGSEPIWDDLDWSSATPSGTSISFQIRASEDFMDLGAWSDTLSSPCSLAELLTEGDSFLQYRVILESSSSDTTPTLIDVTITWDPFGIEGNPNVPKYSLFGATPNPAFGIVNVYFAVPEVSLVEIAIFDLVGHLIITRSQEEYLQGIHHVQLSELSPGIYFCRMVSGEFAATQQFVVIE